MEWGVVSTAETQRILCFMVILWFSVGLCLGGIAKGRAKLVGFCYLLGFILINSILFWLRSIDA